MCCKTVSVGLLAIGMAFAGAISPLVAAPQQFTLAAPQQFALTSPNSSFLLLPNTPRREMQLDFSLRYEKPGVVLDTVGINAAPVGSWAVSLDGEGRIVVQVYDPAQQSAGRVANGWHLLTSRQSLAAGQLYRIVVEFLPVGVSLQINGAESQKLALPTPLSGQALWVGDFPGDDQWGARYRIHPAFVGALTVHYAGLRQNASVAVSAPVSSPATPPHAPIATQVEYGVRALETACRAGKINEVTALLTPDAKGTLGPMLSAHTHELRRLADLLSTGKLQAVHGNYAELQVSEGGRTFTVTLEKIGGVWRLATF